MTDLFRVQLEQAIAKEVAVIAVYCGRNGRARVFTVFERLS
jgi:hypothetical protein